MAKSKSAPKEPKAPKAKAPKAKPYVAAKVKLRNALSAKKAGEATSVRLALKNF